MMLDRIEVLNPVAEMPPASQNIEPAPRPPSLEGKRVGLYWNYKAGGNYALERVEEEIRARFKDASVTLYPSPRPVPQETLHAVKRECDVVVGATGD